jgi:hypothetical protein
MKAFFISTTGDSQLPKSDGTNFLFTLGNAFFYADG